MGKARQKLRGRGEDEAEASRIRQGRGEAAKMLPQGKAKILPITGHQAWFYQIVTLPIILEQSLEWNSSLYINFIVYENAFDNVARQGLSLEVTEALRNTSKDYEHHSELYKGLTCNIIHKGPLTEAFPVRTVERYPYWNTDHIEGKYRY